MNLIKFIEIVAILVGAFSGFIEARRKRMDLVGVFTVAFITAFGGGTLRDILLDRRPTHQEYAIHLRPATPIPLGLRLGLPSNRAAEQGNHPTGRGFL